MQEYTQKAQERLGVLLGDYAEQVNVPRELSWGDLLEKMGDSLCVCQNREPSGPLFPRSLRSFFLSLLFQPLDIDVILLVSVSFVQFPSSDV